MSMTRKDYKLIASILSELKPSEMRYDFAEMSEEQRGKVGQWQRTVRRMTYNLAYAYDNFDADKFMRACGAI